MGDQLESNEQSSAKQNQLLVELQDAGFEFE